MMPVGAQSKALAASMRRARATVSSFMTASRKRRGSEPVPVEEGAGVDTVATTAACTAAGSSCTSAC